jgi:hypothetical protein
MKKKWSGLFKAVAADMGYAPRRPDEFTVNDLVAETGMEVTVARRQLLKLAKKGIYTSRPFSQNGKACLLYRKVKK